MQIAMCATDETIARALRKPAAQCRPARRAHACPPGAHGLLRAGRRRAPIERCPRQRDASLRPHPFPSAGAACDGYAATASPSASSSSGVSRPAAATGIEEIFCRNARHAQHPVDRRRLSLGFAKAERAIGRRTTGTTSRYRPGAAPRFSSSSRRVKRRRASSGVKSRNARRTAFFNFHTVSAPTNTSDICVSSGSDPASWRRNATVSACSGGAVIVGSGVQLADGPAAVRRFRVDRAVVQPERHVLPELEPFRDDAVAGPVGRARDVVARISRLVVGQTALQLRAIGQRARLVGRPGAEPRDARSAWRSRRRLQRR